MTECHERRPATTEGIRLFLASGCIKGVGERWAERIVNRFGTETLRVLDEDPERLLEIPRFGKKRLEAVKGSWAEHQGVRELMIFLQPVRHRPRPCRTHLQVLRTAGAGYCSGKSLQAGHGYSRHRALPPLTLWRRDSVFLRTALCGRKPGLYTCCLR